MSIVRCASLGRLAVGRLSVDRLDMSGALGAIVGLVERRRGGSVFTPNVDHVVLASEDRTFRRAYAAADLALADGMPVVWASHLLRRPVPAKVSGSDLIAPLMALAAARGWSVFLLGGAEGVAQQAAQALQRTHARLNVVGTSSPWIDLSQPASSRAHVIDAVRRAAPDLVVVGLGAPKQELWIHESARALRPAVLFGLGASIDFLAGTATRAPAWMSSCGLEWAYRLGREPRRLWRRYLMRDWKFVGILAQSLLTSRPVPTAQPARPAAGANAR